jgi:hypothetical protein
VIADALLMTAFAAFFAATDSRVVVGSECPEGVAPEGVAPEGG